MHKVIKFILYFIFLANISNNFFFHVRLRLTHVFVHLRRIIRKICIKEKLKFSFSSQKPDIVEVYTITNN